MIPSLSRSKHQYTVLSRALATGTDLKFYLHFYPPTSRAACITFKFSLASIILHTLCYLAINLLWKFRKFLLHIIFPPPGVVTATSRDTFNVIVWQKGSHSKWCPHQTPFSTSPPSLCQYTSQRLLLFSVAAVIKVKAKKKHSMFLE